VDERLGSQNKIIYIIYINQGVGFEERPKHVEIRVYGGMKSIHSIIQNLVSLKK